MIAGGALATIVLVTVAVSAVCAGAGWLALHAARRASMTVRVSIVLLSTVLSICGSAIAIAVAMYLSRHDLVVLIWVIAVSATAGLGVNAWLGVSVARSSARLRLLARAVGAGEVVSAGGTDGAEFTRLAQELADTSARLADAREQVAAAEAARRQLVAWVSHDLRTPLASLRAMTEALEDGMADDPARYLRQMRGQTDVLVSLVDDLFALSTIQSGALVLAMEPVSLFDLVSDAVADLRLVAARREVTLRESRTGDLTLWGDPRELSRVIGNLLMNAIQHSPAGGQILVSATETDSGHVSLSVVDEGGGIPEKDLGRIFDAGWRGSPARSPRPVEPTMPDELAAADPDGSSSAEFRADGRATSAGAGLGLAIVRGIVEAHAGRVGVRNVPGGCRFDVTLPRAQATR